MYTDGRESAEELPGVCVCVCTRVCVVCIQMGGNCCRLPPIGSASSSSLAAILTCVCVCVCVFVCVFVCDMYNDGRGYSEGSNWH